MAEENSLRAESALQKLINIAEEGGYLKKGIKEEILKAVSTIKEYIKTIEGIEKLKNVKGNELGNTREEVSKLHSDAKVQGEDSRTAKQVAPSVGTAHEIERKVGRNEATTTGETSNSDGQDEMQRTSCEEDSEKKKTRIKQMT